MVVAGGPAEAELEPVAKGGPGDAKPVAEGVALPVHTRFAVHTIDRPILPALSGIAPASVQVPAMPLALWRTSAITCKDGGHFAGKMLPSSQEGNPVSF